MRARALSVLALAIAIGCVGQPARTFYDDLDAGGGSDSPADGTVSVEGGTNGGADGANVVADAPSTDAPVDGGLDEPMIVGDAPADSMAAADVEADSLTDAGNDAMLDGGIAPDAAPEAGCGPVNTPLNCGACGQACDTVHSTAPSCDGSTCEYQGCALGWADCHNTPPNTDGCETQLGTITNCNGCNSGCDTVHSTGAACTGSACSYKGCGSGFGDCSSAPPNNDGCETPLNTPTHCGACDAGCDTTHSTGAACPAGTACTYTGCAMGWSNCNKVAPDMAGCECQTPSCCGTGCQTTHQTGIPALSYYDCNPLANSGETVQQLVSQALEACAAYTGAVSQCASGLDCSSAGFPDAGPYVCNGQGGRGSTCTTCWSYGVNGTDFLQTEDCNCPGTPIGTWN